MKESRIVGGQDLALLTILLSFVALLIILYLRQAGRERLLD